jgi:hypothetical protein
MKILRDVSEDSHVLLLVARRLSEIQQAAVTTKGDHADVKRDHGGGPART